MDRPKSGPYEPVSNPVAGICPASQVAAEPAGAGSVAAEAGVGTVTRVRVTRAGAATRATVRRTERSMVSFPLLSGRPSRRILGSPPAVFHDSV